MGLHNNITPNTGGGSKLTIVGGKFTLRVDEGTPGANPRVLTKGKNEGKTVYEMKYPCLSGYIAGGRIVEGEYPGVDIDIIDYAANDSYTISFPLDSRYLFDFIRRLPNIDTSKEVSLELVEGKKKTRTGNPTYNLHVVQFGKQLYDYYTEWKSGADGKPFAEHLHGIPAPTKGVKGWDFRDVEEFLLERFNEFFTDYDAPEDDAPVVEVPPSANYTDADAPEETDESIPF